MSEIIFWIIFLTVVFAVVSFIAGMVLVEIILPFIEEVKKHIK